MADFASHRVIEADLWQHTLKVVNVHARRERLFAHCAQGARLALAGTLIELYPKLCRPLEDVEELSERQVQQRCNYCDGMRDRDEIVEAAAQPLLRDRQRQSRN